MSERPNDPTDAANVPPAADDAPLPPAAPRDGLVGLYALRILDRGVDPRVLVAEHRTTRYGTSDRAHRRGMEASGMPPVRPVGRAAVALAASGTAVGTPLAPSPRPARVRRVALPSLPGLAMPSLATPALAGRGSRRLAAAGLALAAMLGFGVLGVFAQEQPAQQRYVVQQGDSLETVAATFGVSPDAILAASGVQQPPLLTPSEVIVIPGPEQTPEEAAVLAAQLDGSSPFVIGAHVLSEGDTLADVATWYQVPLEELATFNGVTDPEQLVAGQRILIPAVTAETPVASTEETTESSADVASIEPAASTPGGEQLIEVAQPVDLALEAVPASTEVLVPGVPAYHQASNLSSAFAAGYIATSAFGSGIPEAVFAESVPPSPNPHWGYRGNPNGGWGGTTDYGVYAEPIATVLGANGFNAEVFHGFGDPATLRAQLDAGRPVIAWLGLAGDTAYTVEEDGSYLLAPGMHAVVVYGYDEFGVYLSDPASGSYDYYAWEDFLAMWSVLNGMGLAVSPW